jgi:hypothetical protein
VLPDEGCTVAVKVIGCPIVCGFGLAVRLVVVKGRLRISAPSNFVTNAEAPLAL